LLPLKELRRLIVLFLILFLWGCATPADHLLNATKENNLPAVETAIRDLNESGKKYPKEETALETAIRNGRREIVKRMLDSDRPAFQKDLALHCAAKTVHWDMVAFLVEQGARPTKDTVNLVLQETEPIEHIKVMFYPEHQSSGQFLLKALQLGKAELVELLLEMGADTNYQETSELLKVEVYFDGYSVDRLPDPRGMNALGYAIQRGDFDMTRVLLEKGANPNVKLITSTIKYMPSLGVDPVLWRAESVFVNLGDGRVARKEGTKTTILGCGPPPPYIMEVQGNQLSTPLIMSITSKETPHSQKIAIIKLLLDNGADINLTDQKGLTALKHAEELGLTDVQDLLLRKSSQDSELVQAAKDGNVQAVQNLLSAGTAVNMRDEKGVPVIIWAATNGHTEIVRLLLERGADINIKDRATGVTALWIASQEGHTQVVKLLLENSADPNTKSSDGVTALWIASQEGRLDVVRLLLDMDKDADVNVKRTSDGVTALWQASNNGHTNVVKLLLDKGADVEIKRTSDGVTALWQASWKGHKDIVRLLLDKSADVNIKRTTNGATGLWAASYEGHAEVVKLLLEKGADVNAKNNAGLTPLGTSEERGHNEIVELLKQHGAK